MISINYECTFGGVDVFCFSERCIQVLKIVFGGTQTLFGFSATHEKSPNFP